MVDAAEVRGQVTKGLSSVSVSDACGALVVCGADATVVLAATVDERLEALMAVAEWAEGRVAAFAHSDMLALDEDDDSSDKSQLILNAIAWVSKAKRGARVLVHSSAELTEALAAKGVTATEIDDGYAAARRGAGAHDVLIVGDTTIAAKDREAIAQFVRKGGGLLIAATGWAHPHYGPKENGHVIALGHSLLLAEVGILWDESACMDGDGDAEVDVELDDALCDDAHAGADLQRLIEWLGDEDTLDEDESVIARATRNAVRFLRLGTRAGCDTAALCSAIDEAFCSNEDELTPSVERPLAADERWKRSLLSLQTERWRALPADEMESCAAAEQYPGAVPDDAEAEDAVLIVDARVAQWHSTGRYAKPGEVVEVSLGDDALARGLRVRIGAHIDELFTDEDRESGVADDSEYGSDESEWKRWPELSFEFALRERESRVASPFGGLVYIVVPEDGEGRFEVTVRGCVRAPRFVLGESSVFEWQHGGRDAPAPWGELACDRLIFTLPSSALRTVDDPEALMRFWSSAMQCYEEITSTKYRRPERIVGDCQPSLGYMHSGYPIVAWLDDEDQGLLTVLDARKVVSEGTWGPLHELAHNVQSDAWTFEHTDEVTNNVLVLFVMDVLCGFAPKDNPQLADARKKGVVPCSQWDDDPFAGLVMYAQIQTAFGWQPFIDVFAQYRALSEDALPSSDEDKRDQWMLRLSKRVGHNLAPFFERWGVETSAKARKSVQSLPEWKPASSRSPRR
jgi:hypothetical protein